jgi:hypothetical protein
MDEPDVARNIVLTGFVSRACAVVSIKRSGSARLTLVVVIVSRTETAMRRTAVPFDFQEIEANGCVFVIRMREVRPLITQRS